MLYSSEHGPKTDDEINIIEPGRNYGWPHVAGYRDDKAYIYGAWAKAVGVPCEQLEYRAEGFPASVPQARESEWLGENFVEPIATFFTVGSGFRFTDLSCGAPAYVCWPSIAPGSNSFYGSAGIPGWADSLLVPSLKHGAVYRVPLSQDGKTISGEPVRYFKTQNRYRDLVVSPNGTGFYISTDNAGPTTTSAGRATTTLENPGSILEFRYTGQPN
jgi:PQQ-dependent dehydrogenase (s-GDH family)